ncbi:MAG: hypothetical protein IJ456_02335 [Bacteroides sp.]|nr:hypothetical protein [Bacteroides sp.]
MEHINYKIQFEIKGRPLWIPFGSYTDYTILDKEELKEFIFYLIKRCINSKAFMNGDEDSLFVKNIHLYKEGNKFAICSIEERSVQIYP